MIIFHILLSYQIPKPKFYNSNLDKMERYEKLTKIGVGAYGIVYKARDTKLNILVALKRIQLEESDDGIPGKIFVASLLLS